MKKGKFRYLLLAVLMLPSCTAGLEPLNMRGNSSLDVKYTSTGLTPADYDQWVNSWSKPGHVYFHYNRGTEATLEEYDNYCLWFWSYYPNNLEGTLWGYTGETHLEKVTLVPMSTQFMTNAQTGGAGEDVHVDEFGVIFDVDLTNPNLKGGKTGDAVSFEGTQEVGFLLPLQSSMGGNTNWTSDGDAETYISEYGNEESWRKDDAGEKFMHIFVSTGALDEYTFFAGSAPQPKENPVDVDETGSYRSKMDNVPMNDYTPATSEAFKNDGIGYQIFVASFRDTNGDGIGDIKGITESLDYLQDLGVDVLWLTPIQKSNSYHGYDITDYTAVDRRYGTMEDYEELLSKAHAKGMKVLMDLVLNHTSKTNKWFANSKWAKETEYTFSDGSTEIIKWRDIYTWKFRSDTIKKANIQKEGDKWVCSGYTNISVKDDADSSNPSWYRDGESNYYYYGKFGSGMPELNYENLQTRKLVKDVGKFWLKKGLDGFRLDAVKHIYMRDEVSDEKLGSDIIIADVGENNTFDDERGEYVKKKFDYSTDVTRNVNWWKEFSHDLKQENPNCFLVGENFDGWGTRISNYYRALDSQFDFSNYYHVPAWIHNTDEGCKSFDIENGGGQAAETYWPFASDEYYDVDAKKIDGSDAWLQGGGRPDFINGAFTSNHDVMRLINQANGVGDKNATTASDNVVYGDQWANGRAKFQAAVTLLNPGLSWIYYGDELGMTSNTNKHIAKYGNENSMDIWYRQPFLWADKKSRSNYKFGQYSFEFDDHNKHLVNNGEGINYDPTTGKFTTLNTMYDYFKGLCYIKSLYPKNAKITFKYCSFNVMRIDVAGEGTRELVIFLNCGRSMDEYLINIDNAPAYKLAANLDGAPSVVGGDIGRHIFGLTAFYKG